MATSPVCLIVADSFEPEGIPAELSRLGVPVERRRLPVGDYDLGSGTLVERKAVPDLHLSLQRGRLWQQVGDLRRAARRPYLLVEGRELDVRGGIGPNAIRGACLAVLGQGVPLLFSRDRTDSARWLWLLARRVGGTGLGRDRPVYSQRLKPEPDHVPEAMLAAVPGISVGTARALLRRFGSVTGVLVAGERAWTEVPGMGQARASALRRAISSPVSACVPDAEDGLDV
jgi:ERCC4-type nuclease